MLRKTEDTSTSHRRSPIFSHPITFLPLLLLSYRDSPGLSKHQYHGLSTIDSYIRTEESRCSNVSSAKPCPLEISAFMERPFAINVRSSSFSADFITFSMNRKAVVFSCRSSSICPRRNSIFTFSVLQSSSRLMYCSHSSFASLPWSIMNIFVKTFIAETKDDLIKSIFSCVLRTTS